jgi:hypothetical protein
VTERLVNCGTRHEPITLQQSLAPRPSTRIQAVRALEQLANGLPRRFHVVRVESSVFVRYLVVRGFAR